MLDQNLINYIQQNLRNGFAESEIRQALQTAGWGVIDIEEAFLNAAPAATSYGRGMDILEKELDAEPLVTATKSNHTRRLLLILITIALLVTAALTGFWLYQRFADNPEVTVEGDLSTATTLDTSAENEAALRDQRRVEHIENLQTALAAFKAAKGAYPANLELLVAEKFLGDLPHDPQTAEPYLYSPFGEQVMDYSITFLLETDFGTMAAGLNEATPNKLIRAGNLKTENQTIKGVIIKSPSPELLLTGLTGREYAAGEEAEIDIQSQTALNQAILIVDRLRISKTIAPFRFRFSAPESAGEYPIKIYAFAKNGDVLYQESILTVKH